MSAATEEETPVPVLPGALDMARDWARAVSLIAATAPAHSAAGKAQFEAGQMAGFMALVSIAEDVHRITEVLVHTDAELSALEHEEPEP